MVADWKRAGPNLFFLNEARLGVDFGLSLSLLVSG